MKWKPIETADKSKSILITDGNSIFQVRWDFLNCEWLPENCYSSDGECSVYIKIEPTKWREFMLNLLATIIIAAFGYLFYLSAFAAGAL